MADLHHEIEIEAPPEKVYEAITTTEGLRGWWTSDSVAEATVGSVAEFGFFNRGTVFRMQIDKLRPRKRVVWTCVGGPEEWQGTVLTWVLSREGDKTKLRFKHGKWRSSKGDFARCNSTWGALLYRLKSYAEGKSPGPHFT
jgi:uncharacterized protein YndB with AHSA1/START domain